eukprot:scaffold73711_cov71-Phaeocystis_antarctica.AAC.1
MEQPLYGIRAARAQIDQRVALSKRTKRLDPLWIYPPLERRMGRRRAPSREPAGYLLTMPPCRGGGGGRSPASSKVRKQVTAARLGGSSLTAGAHEGAAAVEVVQEGDVHRQCRVVQLILISRPEQPRAPRSLASLGVPAKRRASCERGDCCDADRVAAADCRVDCSAV